MGAKVAFAHTRVKPAGDVVGFDVPPRGVHVRGAGQTLEGHVAMPGGHAEGTEPLGISMVRSAWPLLASAGTQSYVAAIDHRFAEPERPGCGWAKRSLAA